MATIESAKTSGAKYDRRLREHRQRDPDEAVAAHLQEDRGQDHRAGGRRLDMRVGQPGVDRPHRHLHREGGEEGEPQPGLRVVAELRGGLREQRRDVGGAGGPVHRHDGEEHQDRAEQRVEEELEARIDAPLAAPDADDQEHRDQAGLEEQVEQHEVEGREDADHRRLEDEEGDHVLLDAVLDRVPRSQDAERHQERREQDERHREAVDAELEADVRRRARHGVSTSWKPGVAGIEARPGDERKHEGHDRRGERRPAGVGAHRLLVAAQRQDEGRADERQDEQAGEDAEAEHQRAPVAR